MDLPLACYLTLFCYSASYKYKMEGKASSVYLGNCSKQERFRVV